ncbi:hypothetical protein ACFVWN_19930 [Nocardiopsis flavescens]|uniref:Uncharacterized protein n=1 Tax=Nocardiopsis flavescens TaxID=758803 RepID=A0A1M6NSG5_9ACTN|nr:hypothetical protein [Nocardiopsis flavescens]SHJ98614.1 hypothetical protein SAMN05421803_11281 [Nocardiopsis flavescens]
MGERSAYDEIDGLRERLRRLEVRVFEERARADRGRTASLGLVAAATVLFLAPALPWLRRFTETRGFRFTNGGEAAIGEPRAFATGWELWWQALVEGRWGLVLGFLALAVAAGLAVWAAVALRGPALLAAQVAAVPGPLLFLLSWPQALEEAPVSAGPGVFTAVAACVLVLAAAQYGKGDG